MAEVVVVDLVAEAHLLVPAVVDSDPAAQAYQLTQAHRVTQVSQLTQAHPAVPEALDGGNLQALRQLNLQRLQPHQTQAQAEVQDLAKLLQVKVTRSPNQILILGVIIANPPSLNISITLPISGFQEISFILAQAMATNGTTQLKDHSLANLTRTA